MAEIRNSNLDQKITVDSGYTEADPQKWLEEGIMPGTVLKNQKSDSKNFPATGKIEKTSKARGKITVYNSFSESSQTLVANTRFISTDGKLFKSLERETIPGRTTENGKIIPGELEIEVEAAEPGSGYNIGPSTFSIPGFAGTAKYTAFYGKSSSAMAGGFEGEAFEITQEDLDKADSEVSARAKGTGIDAVKKTLSGTFVLADREKAVLQQILEKVYSDKAGEEVDSFSLMEQAETIALVFKQADISNLAKNFIGSSIPEDKAVDEDSFEFSYSVESPLSWPKSQNQEKKGALKEIADSLVKVISEPVKMDVNITIRFRIYSKIDGPEIEESLLGKPIEEVKRILTENSQIKKAKIDAGPAWRKKIPSDRSKVEFKINTEPIKGVM